MFRSKFDDWSLEAVDIADTICAIICMLIILFYIFYC